MYNNLVFIEYWCYPKSDLVPNKKHLLDLWKYMDGE